MNDLVQTIKAGKYGFEGDEWTYVSAEARDLISKLIVVDPKQRLVPCAALKHPWFDDVPADVNALSPKATLQIQKNLKKNKRRLTKSKASTHMKTKRMSFNMDIRGAVESHDIINRLRLEENDGQGSFTDSDPPSIEENIDE